MKLSDFRVNKTLNFNNDDVEVVAKTNNINFYNLTYDIIEKINNDVIQKLNNNESDEKILYMVIPYLCDLELDEPFESFLSIVKLPPKNFQYFINSIVEITNDLFDSASNIAIKNENIEKLNSNIEKITETKEQILDKLYEKLSNIKNDKEKRKEILQQISKLETSEV